MTVVVVVILVLLFRVSLLVLVVFFFRDDHTHSYFFYYDCRWEGEGEKEVGINAATGDVIVRVDPRYFRPTEVDHLLGDPTKAKKSFGWTPEYTFDVCCYLQLFVIGVVVVVVCCCGFEWQLLLLYSIPFSFFLSFL